MGISGNADVRLGCTYSENAVVNGLDMEMEVTNG